MLNTQRNLPVKPLKKLNQINSSTENVKNIVYVNTQFTYTDIIINKFIYATKSQLGKPLATLC